MLNEYEEDLDKIEFECLHLINFDDDEDEEEVRYYNQSPNSFFGPFSIW